jgi:hypothetical protein
MSISSGMLLSTEMSWSSTTFSLGVLTTNACQIGQFLLVLAHNAEFDAMVGWRWLVGWSHSKSFHNRQPLA